MLDLDEVTAPSLPETTALLAHLPCSPKAGLLLVHLASTRLRIVSLSINRPPGRTPVFAYPQALDSHFTLRSVAHSGLLAVAGAHQRHHSHKRLLLISFAEQGAAGLRSFRGKRR